MSTYNGTNQIEVPRQWHRWLKDTQDSLCGYFQALEYGKHCMRFQFCIILLCLKVKQSKSTITT